jgi:hypothetical protein
LSESDITESRWSVKKEKDRVDVHISNGDYHIIIENKLYAGDQEKQLQRYIELVEKTAEPEKIIVVYLSLNRDKPSQYSLGDWQLEDGYLVKDDKKIQYINLHYQDKNEFNIHKWVSESKDDLKKLQLAHLDNVLFGLEQYLTVIKYLYGEKVNNITTLSYYVSSSDKPSEEYKKLKYVFSKITDYEKLRKDISKTFIESLHCYLSDNINPEKWILNQEISHIHGENFYDKGRGLPIRISQRSDINGESKVVFAFEWNDDDKKLNRVGYNPLFGIVRRDESINIFPCKYLFKKVKSENNEESSWWLYSEYWDKLDSTEHKGDAVGCILSFDSAQVAAKDLGEKMIDALNKYEKLVIEANNICSNFFLSIEKTKNDIEGYLSITKSKIENWNAMGVAIKFYINAKSESNIALIVRYDGTFSVRSYLYGKDGDKFSFDQSEWFGWKEGGKTIKAYAFGSDKDGQSLNLDEAKEIIKKYAAELAEKLK